MKLRIIIVILILIFSVLLILYFISKLNSDKDSPIKLNSDNEKYKLISSEFNSNSDNLILNNLDRENKIKTFIEKNPSIRDNKQYVTKYDTVYVTSDIHSDYRKFIQTLVSIGLINIPNGINIYSVDGIYDHRIITESTWNPMKKKTLFVIVGDLVDGKRKSSVLDNRGNFELLLHAFIYNMRIEALKYESNIVFTIGNHDHHTIIAPITNEHIAEKYITDKSKKYFKTLTNRRSTLLPFYECNPFYIFKLINKDDSDNTIFVHGGLHSKSGRIPYYDDIIKIQNKLSFNGLLNNINELDIFSRPPRKGENYEKFSPVWTRYYSEKSEACTDVKKDFTNTLIVVGHTQTSSFINKKRLESIIDFNQYATCNKTQSCVLLGCPRETDNGPNIAWVDSSISSAFFNNTLEEESKRQIEILKLGHSKNTKRYYNTIDRVRSPEHKIINVFK